MWKPKNRIYAKTIVVIDQVFFRCMVKLRGIRLPEFRNKNYEFYQICGWFNQVFDFNFNIKFR